MYKKYYFCILLLFIVLCLPQKTYSFSPKRSSEIYISITNPLTTLFFDFKNKPINPVYAENNDPYIGLTSQISYLPVNNYIEKK